MSYWVHGWVETGSALGPDRTVWRARLSLDLFSLLGDPVSDLLFGLAKKPSLTALFKGRGLPPDASKIVTDTFVENQRGIDEHQDGDFGHTYALLSEIQTVQAQLDEVLATSQHPGWGQVFQTIDTFPKEIRGAPDSIRLVVWAYW